MMGCSERPIETLVQGSSTWWQKKISREKSQMARKTFIKQRFRHLGGSGWDREKNRTRKNTKLGAEEKGNKKVYLMPRRKRKHLCAFPVDGH